MLPLERLFLLWQKFTWQHFAIMAMAMGNCFCHWKYFAIWIPPGNVSLVSFEKSQEVNMAEGS